MAPILALFILIVIFSSTKAINCSRVSQIVGEPMLQSTLHLLKQQRMSLWTRSTQSNQPARSLEVNASVTMCLFWAPPSARRSLGVIFWLWLAHPCCLPCRQARTKQADDGWLWLVCGTLCAKPRASTRGLSKGHWNTEALGHHQIFGEWSPCLRCCRSLVRALTHERDSTRDRFFSIVFKISTRYTQIK